MEVNPALCALLEKSPEDILGNLIADTPIGNDRERYQQFFQTLQAGSSIQNYSITLHIQSNTARIVKLSAVIMPLTEESRLLVTVTDNIKDTLNDTINDTVNSSIKNVEPHAPSQAAERGRDRPPVPSSGPISDQILNRACASIGQFRVFGDRTWQYDYISAGCEQVFGFTAAEIVQPELWRSRVLPDDLQSVILPSMDAILAGQPAHQEYRFRHKDGSLRWILSSLSPQWDEASGGWVVAFVDTDITDRKRLEAERQEAEAALRQSEERFRQIATTIHQLFFVCDAQSGDYLYISPAYETIWGRSCESLYRNPRSWVEAVHPGDRPRVLASLSQQLEGTSVQREYRILRPDGTTRWVRAEIFSVLDEAGTVVRYVGIAEDITERKHAELERDLAETALRDSEEKFASFFRCSPAAIAISRLDNGQYIEVNTTFEQCTGYAREEVIHRTAADLNVWVDLSQRERLIQLVRERGSVNGFEFQLRQKTGEIRTILMSAERYELGDYAYLMTVGVDISERKQTEETLRQSEARFQRLATNVLAMLYQYKLETDGSECFTYVSPRCRDIYELEPEVMQQHYTRAWEMIHPDDREEVRQASICSAQRLERFEIECRLILPSGRQKWIRVFSQPERQDNGDILWDGLVLDITERKSLEADRQRAEAALQTSEQHRRLALELTQTGSWEFDVATGEAIWSEGHFALMGLESGTQPSNYQTWRDRVHPQDLEWVEQTFAQALAQRTLLNVEYRVVHPDGTERWVLTKGQGIYDENGQPVRMTGVMMDISDRKRSEFERQQAEAALQANEARYRRLIENIPNSAIHILDCNLVMTFTGGQILDVLNLTPDFFVGRHMSDFVSEADYRRLEPLMQQALAGEDTQSEVSFMGRDFLINFHPLHDPSGEVEGLLVVSHNITERKAMELEIRRQRDLRELLFDESSAALFLVDVNTIRTVDCNRRAVELFEVASKTDLIDIEGHTLQKQPFTTAEQADILRALDQYGYWSTEREYVTRTGREFWGELSAKHITFGDRQFNLVRVADISDRKAAELSLQRQFQREQTLNQVIQAIRQSLGRVIN